MTVAGCLSLVFASLEDKDSISDPEVLRIVELLE